MKVSFGLFGFMGFVGALGLCLAALLEGGSYILFYDAIIVMLMILPLIIVKDADDLFSPYLILVVNVILLVIVSSLMIDWQPDWLIERALIYNVLYFSAFFVGMMYRSVWLEGLGARVLCKLPSKWDEFSFQKVRLYTWVSMGFTAIIFVGSIVVSGINPYVNPIEYRWYMSSGGMDYISQLFLFLLSSCLYINLLIDFRFSARNIVVFLVFLLLTIGLGRRGIVVIGFMMTALFWHNLRHRIKPLRLLVFFIPLVIFIVVAGVQRMIPADSFSERIVMLWQFMQHLGLKTIVSQLLVNFDSFRNSLYFFDQYNNVYDNFHFFQPILDFLLQPIPRSLMHDKPLLFSIEMTKQFLPSVYENGASFDFGEVAEGYYIAGPIGIAILAAINGIVTRTLVSLYGKNRRHLSFMFLYTFLIFLPTYWFKGGMINSFASIAAILFFIPAFLLLTYLRKPKCGTSRIPKLSGEVCAISTGRTEIP